MAVVQMQKVRLVVHSSQADEALAVIQKVGAVEFRPVAEASELSATDASFPHEKLLPRLQHAIQFLQPYVAKRSLWRVLRDGSQTELSEKDIIRSQQDTDVIAMVVQDLEDLQVGVAEAEDVVHSLKKQCVLLQEWKSLSIPLAKLHTTRTQTVLVSWSGVASTQTLASAVAEELESSLITCVITEVSATAIAVTMPQGSGVREDVVKRIESMGASIVTPPEGENTPDVEFVATTERLATAEGELAMQYDQAEHFAITHFRNLQIAAEVLSWQRDRFLVLDDAAATKYTVVFDGWLNTNKRTAVEALFDRQEIAAVFTTLEVADGEEPPVEIQNHPLVQPFEAVTRLYGMPGYRDLDPTVFLAGFFFLFFGLSLTDVGYGLFLMVAATLILMVLKVAPAIRLFAKLLLFVGFSTVLVGLLFGGYFGIPAERIPNFLVQLQQFDPIGNPLPVFYLALGLGVVQVMVGMMLKIYSEYRNGRLVDGILDQGPWLLVFGLGILYLGTATGYIDILSPAQIINLLYVGVIMIVLASGRKGETIVGKMQSAFLSLYSAIGYFSDILSYSRLLALGLATTALAFAVNLIAGMVSDVPYIGVLLALIILIIGHLFTLAVNTLGAFIHSARLQFVEFFGKFITGTGKVFSPLARSEKHVTVRDD
jgi:V/A-type H+/Na+-transporting ATPase subunit I